MLPWKNCEKHFQFHRRYPDQSCSRTCVLLRSWLSLWNWTQKKHSLNGYFLFHKNLQNQKENDHDNWRTNLLGFNNIISKISFLCQCYSGIGNFPEQIHRTKYRHWAGQYRLQVGFRHYNWIVSEKLFSINCLLFSRFKCASCCVTCNVVSATENISCWVFLWFEKYYYIIDHNLWFINVLTIFQTDLKRLGWNLLLRQKDRRVDLEYRTFYNLKNIFQYFSFSEWAPSLFGLLQIEYFSKWPFRAFLMLL